MNISILDLKDRENLKFETSGVLDNADSWVKYFKRNQHVGLELELEYNGSDFDCKTEFGTDLHDYHHYHDCSRCEKGIIFDCMGRYLRLDDYNKAFFCHMINDDNIIVNCEIDGSIEGIEFLLHGANLDTIDFMNKLPIDKWQKFFEYNANCSIHAHSIIPYNKRVIPTIILHNLYQLYRKYYIGLVYLSGTTTHSALRSTGYSEFNAFNKSFKKYLNEGMHTREGLNFNSCRFDNNYKITQWNIEIRTFDASINPFHIGLCRFLTRALVLRAVELSQFGVLQIINNDSWRKNKHIVQELNYHNNIGFDERETMHYVSKELYIEIEHLLTAFEKKIMDKFIESPIWINENHLRDSLIKRDKSYFDKTLIMLVKTKAYFAENRREFYKKIAKVLDTTEDYVRNRLNEIGAKWNKDIGTYTLNNY